jgi:hypothetical protein
MMPPMGKMKTRTDQRSLWLTGREDLRTSTGRQLALGASFFERDFAVVGLTPDEDVEHEDDESDDSAAGAVLRGRVHGLEGLVCDGRGVAEGC